MKAPRSKVYCLKTYGRKSFSRKNLIVNCTGYRSLWINSIISINLSSKIRRYLKSSIRLRRHSLIKGVSRLGQTECQELALFSGWINKMRIAWRLLSSSEKRQSHLKWRICRRIGSIHNCALLFLWLKSVYFLLCMSIKTLKLSLQKLWTTYFIKSAWIISIRIYLKDWVIMKMWAYLLHS